MEKEMRVMTENPLNAETPVERLRTWITGNDVFFKRNQGQIPGEKIDLSAWKLVVDGRVDNELNLTFDHILARQKIELANTQECSGNSRSLLEKKASGNPWTIGGVGNALWGGIWLKGILDEAGLQEDARHVCFEGFDIPKGKAQIKFIRSIPIDKAMDSTLLAYEMNGEPLPLEHGFPLRALALGWTGANCVKWLQRITLLPAPVEGFFMDRVYRLFQKGEDPKSGEVITQISLKSIITQPLQEAKLTTGIIPIRGAAYAGETGIERVEVSLDRGSTWNPTELIGLDLPYAWRHWEYLWEVKEKGPYTILTRATDIHGNQQPDTASWNVFGYCNNAIQDHAVSVQIA
ncbi:MAG: sulfite oxidase [Desulfobacterales bacterium]|nr:sulfite oxidase [Desulfobacterales bacterium]MDX2511117.1 sulfite oxidase [Desulfobacterales bacterium]